MVCPSSNYLLSKRVVAVLKSQNLPEHKFFPARLIGTKGDPIDGYSFFYLPSLHEDHIAFTRSQFSAGDNSKGYKDIMVTSADDLFKVDDFLNVKKVALQNTSSSLDLIKVKLPIGLLASPKLQAALAALDVTGIKIKKMEVEFI
ncbi:MAG TPA: hypothetical protein VGD40_02225 [Chryseosolibacter sp.]